MALEIRCNNSLVCKQMTTFSLSFFFSAQLVNAHFSLQDEFAAK